MNAPGTFVILATLDTKAEEAGFLRDRLWAAGHEPLLMDIGIGGTPALLPDISRAEVAAAAGVSWDQFALLGKSEAMEKISEGAAALLRARQANGELAGVLALGGGQGTYLAASAMRQLPLGVPKVIVTTIIGRAALHVGASDIVMVPSITDLAGLNRILAPQLAAAVGIVLALASARNTPGLSSKPLVAMTMFGVTTAGGDCARERLTTTDREVAVFHANGNGGRTMEALIESGSFTGVLDWTITELADELAGGIATAGPHRLEAAGKAGIPQLVVPGAIDVINFGPPESVPSAFSNRLFHQHTPVATLMRTSAAESRRLGELVGTKLNRSIGPVAVVIPTQGFSALGAPGQPFHDEEADQAFVDALRTTLDASIPLELIDRTINDPEFATTVADRFVDLLNV